MHNNRLRITDAIVHSCIAYSKKDTDTAFRWAVEALQRAKPEHTEDPVSYLNPHEANYIQTILELAAKSLKKKKKRK